MSQKELANQERKQERTRLEEWLGEVRQLDGELIYQPNGQQVATKLTQEVIGQNYRTLAEKFAKRRSRKGNPERVAYRVAAVILEQWMTTGRKAGPEKQRELCGSTVWWDLILMSRRGTWISHQAIQAIALAHHTGVKPSERAIGNKELRWLIAAVTNRGQGGEVDMMDAIHVATLDDKQWEEEQRELEQARQWLGQIQLDRRIPKAKKAEAPKPWRL